MTDEITKVRNEISKAVVSFVKDPDNENKILLLTLSQGLGKSVTTAKALLDTDISFIFLMPSHENVVNLFRKNSVLSPYNVFHLKGRGAKVSPDSGELMCQNPLLDKVSRRNISVMDFLCKQRCGHYQNCRYLEQFKTLMKKDKEEEKKPQSWASVYQFISTKFLHDYPCDCVVLDENPLGGLHREVEFNVNDLDDLAKILNEIQRKVSERFTDITDEKEGIDYYFFNQCYASVIVIISILKKLVTNLSREEILSGKSLIDMFVGELKSKRVLNSVEQSFKFSSQKTLFHNYSEELYELFSDNAEFDTDFKNIFYDVVRIAKDCLRCKDIKEDINFSTVLRWHKKERNTITYYSVTKELPDKPIIILDATGDKEVYQNIFGREIIRFDMPVEIKRNIIQIKDGLYPKQSLYHEETRTALYRKVAALIRHWVESGECNKVFVITHKGYSAIKYETNGYKGMSIESYFCDEDLPKQWYDIKHFGSVKGLNVVELMENGKLIIIGTPEPNIVGYLEDVRIWYQGEKLIENDRIIEPSGSEFFGHNFRYKDERYMAHVRMAREHLIEHAIERVRFIFQDAKKLVVLWSMLPIDFETDKMTSIEFMEKYVPDFKTHQSVFVTALSYIRKKPTRSQFSQASGNWKCTFQAGGRKKLRELLIKLDLIEEIKSGKVKQLQLTDKGKEYYENAK